MAKRERITKSIAEREVESRFEKREDFTDQGINIKWSWFRTLVEFLKQGKRNRIKRNREKNVNTKISSSK